MKIYDEAFNVSNKVIEELSNNKKIIIAIDSGRQVGMSSMGCHIGKFALRGKDAN